MSDALKRLIERIGTGERGPGLDTASVFGDSQTAMDAVDAFDGSLDAAKALQDALLPDHWLGELASGRGPDGKNWYACVNHIGARQGVYCHDATDTDPARAWLLAILRAYQQVQA